MERTLVLLKPDLVTRHLIGQVLAIYERNGLVIENLQRVRASQQQVESHYAEHLGRPFYEGLILSLADQNIAAVILSGNHAIEKVRTLNGATDPKQALAGTIRGQYALSMRENSVHASDSIENAEREIQIWFGENPKN